MSKRNFDEFQADLDDVKTEIPEGIYLRLSNRLSEMRKQIDKTSIVKITYREQHIMATAYVNSEDNHDVAIRIHTSLRTAICRVTARRGEIMDLLNTGAYRTEWLKHSMPWCTEIDDRGHLLIVEKIEHVGVVGLVDKWD